MNAGVASIAGLALLVGLWLYWHKSAPKSTTLLFLIAGIGLGGGLGVWLGATLGRALTAAGNTEAAAWVGLGASTLLAGAAILATLEVVIKGLWRKKAKPKRWHPWLALALPTIIAIGSVPVLTEAMAWFSSLVTEIGTAVRDGLGG